MKKAWIIVVAASQLILSGCWDQRILKESRLVFGTGMDLIEDDRLLVTSVIRDYSNNVPINAIVTGEGRTFRETRMDMDRKIAGRFDPSKNRVFLFGEKLVQKDLYSFLDVVYRDPDASVSSKLAVVKGNAGDVLNAGRVQNVLIAEYLIKLIESEEKETTIPEQSLQTICSVLFDDGKDFGLPAIKREGDEIILDGMAMFNRHTLAGYLSPDETVLLQMLLNKKAKIARYVSKINENQEPANKNYISYTFLKSKAKMKILSAQPGRMRAEITMKAEINVAEYPQDTLTKEKTKKQLNRKISKELTEDAERVISKIQEANSDLFGIARELMAYYPDRWDKVEWKKEYPSMEIVPKVEVEITEYGVIN
ncbi:Ger(x)C family spore germination protein [Bacillus mangrovi]|uniref:Ger(X)C family spore germination protein n=1 Tax=Metabacillus mangrovi TaxID=1491830 RepID=A0A7X2V634_9BACI|nr:Ger(x)C family spore germination protein [Metabacillus mangrovi]MTH55452.1 Ger(x)C family spore germination protein [Metabacillus mangrovi]